MRVEEGLVVADYYLSYCPGLSTVVSIVDTIVKLFMLVLSEERIADSAYFQYLEQKSFSLCAASFFPIIGNIVLFYMNKKDCPLDLWYADLQFRKGIKPIQVEDRELVDLEAQKEEEQRQFFNTLRRECAPTASPTPVTFNGEKFKIIKPPVNQT